jgi:hypothetical protein
VAKPSLLEVSGNQVKVSNPDKVLYPLTEFTKPAVIDYHADVSPGLLPHRKDRPISSDHLEGSGASTKERRPRSVGIRDQPRPSANREKIRPCRAGFYSKTGAAKNSWHFDEPFQKLCPN